MPLGKQELLPLPENLSLTPPAPRPVFSGVRIAQSLVICVLFFFFGHSIIYPSTIYGFYIVLVAYVASFSGLSFLIAPSIFPNVHRYDVVSSKVKANESLKHLSDIKSSNIYKTTVFKTFEEKMVNRVQKPYTIGPLCRNFQSTYKGNNKITELRTILQRKSQNS